MVTGKVGAAAAADQYKWGISITFQDHNNDAYEKEETSNVLSCSSSVFDDVN